MQQNSFKLKHIINQMKQKRREQSLYYLFFIDNLLENKYSTDTN